MRRTIKVVALYLLAIWMAIPAGAQATRDSIVKVPYDTTITIPHDTTVTIPAHDTVIVVTIPGRDSTWTVPRDTVISLCCRDSIIKVPVITPPPIAGHPNLPPILARFSERDFATALEDGWSWCFPGSAQPPATNYSTVQRVDMASRGTAATGVATYRAGYAPGTGPICLQRPFGREVNQVYIDFDFATSPNWFGHAILDKILYVTTGKNQSGPVFFGIKGTGSQPQHVEIHVSAAVTGTVRILKGGSLTRGIPSRIEILLTLNTCDVANGRAQVWLNGNPNPVIDFPNVMFRSTRYSNTTERNGCAGFSMTKWSPVWGGSGTVNIPALQTQSIGYWFSAGN